MKALFIGTFFIFSSIFATFAQYPPKPTISTAVTAIDSIHVEIEGGKSLQVKKDDLAKLSRREVKAKDHDGKESTYSGVELREVLKLAGAKFGTDLRGSAMAYYLLVAAADNYHAVFALPELDDTYTDKIVILADTQDGKPLTDKNGPWQIVVPDEKKHARWVRQVTSLAVKRASVQSVADIANEATDDEDLIRLEILKDLLARWHDSSEPRFVSVDEHDPSKWLLTHLNDLGFKVRSGSESFIDRNSGDSVRDEITQKEGVLFEVKKLTLVSKDEARAYGGNYLGNMGASGCTFLLKRENGQWKISSQSHCYVS